MRRLSPALRWGLALCTCLAIGALALLIWRGSLPWLARPLGYRYTLTDVGAGTQESPVASRATFRLSESIQAPPRRQRRSTFAAQSMSAPAAPMPLVAYIRAINHYGQVVAGEDPSGALWTPDAPNSPTGSYVDFTGVFPPGAHVKLDALNDFGQVAGELWQGDQQQLFLWTPAASHGATGTVTLLQTRDPGSSFLDIGGLNNYGQLLLEGGMPALWTPTQANGAQGVRTTIPLPGGAVHGDVLWLNDYGQAGVLTATTVYDQRVSLWTPDQAHGVTGTLTSIGEAGDDMRALNAYGQVLGETLTGDGWVWTPTQRNGTSGTRTLFNSGDSTWWNLNDAGVAGGLLFTKPLFGDKNVAAVWLPAGANAAQGQIESIGGEWGDSDSDVLALNQEGQVLGKSCTLERIEESACNTSPHLFVWDQAHGMHDLLALVDGWPAFDVEDRIGAINDAGQIVIAASDSQGRGHVILLTPHMVVS